MQRRAEIQKRAFTLIELLVVIAIIALLLSVLMPSLRKAREQARNAVCVSHLHSWGNSYALYGNDWDQKVCPTLVYYYKNGALDAIVCWDEILKRYYVDDKIRLCTSAQKLSTNGPGLNNSYHGSKNTAWHVDTGHSNGTVYHAAGSYGMNSYACYPEANVWEEAGQVSLAWHWGMMTEKNAREIPLLGDSDWREAWPDNTDKPRDKENYIPNPPPTVGWNSPFHGIDIFCMRRHTKSVNHVFLDSSVRHILLPDLWKLRWNKEFDTNKTVIFSDLASAWMTK